VTDSVPIQSERWHDVRECAYEAEHNGGHYCEGCEEKPERLQFDLKSETEWCADCLKAMPAQTRTDLGLSSHLTVVQS
jgi:hypothetical protein